MNEIKNKFFSPFSITKININKKFSKNDILFKEYIITKILKEQNKIFFISEKEIKNILKLNSYETVDEFLEKFKIKHYIFSIIDEELTSFNGYINILDGIIKKDNIYKFIITDTFFNIFNEPNNEFKKIKFDTILKFNDIYTTNLFNFLYKYIKEEKIKITIEKLKEIMEIEQKKYMRFFDFEKIILKKSIKDIQKHSNLQISYIKIKEGNKNSKVKGVLFQIKDLEIDIIKNQLNNISNLIKSKCKNYELIMSFIKIELKKKKYDKIIENINYAILHPNKNFDTTLISSIKYDLINNEFKNLLEKYNKNYNLILNDSLIFLNINDFRKYIVEKIENLKIDEFSQIINFLKKVFDIYINSFQNHQGINDNPLYKAIFIDLEKENRFIYKTLDIIILCEYNGKYKSNFAILKNKNER